MILNNKKEKSLRFNDLAGTFRIILKPFFLLQFFILNYLIVDSSICRENTMAEKNTMSEKNIMADNKKPPSQWGY